MKSNTVLNVNKISKKFCRSLKRSLWYGLCDIAGELANVESADKKVLREGEFWAINDVSFDLKPGESLGLIGANGAGKSTLLKMINGLIKPDGGEIRIGGYIGALIELGTGFNPILSGRENIYINGAVLGFSKKQIDRRIDAIIDFSEIEHAIDSPVKNYSSGMRVRLGFSVAAQLEPDLLLIDEVLAVGDLAFQQKCIQSLKRRLQNGCALIFVSHNIRVVQAMCSRLLFLDEGKMIACGKPADVAAQYLQKLSARRQPVGDDSGAPPGALSKTDVTVSSVRLQGEHAEAKNTFVMNDFLDVEVVVQAHRPVKDASLGITIWTQDNLLVSTLSSYYQGFKIDFTAGEYHFRCKIGPLNLLPGQYFLRGGCYDGFAGFPYDQWGWDNRMVSFRVATGTTQSGSMVLYDGLGITSVPYVWQKG